MSKPWFRMYARTLTNEKVQSLSGDLFKFWVNLLCLARENDGDLPTISHIARRLNVRPTTAASRINDLIVARLIDHTDHGLVPHDWDEMQYESDTSARRMKRLRAKQSSEKSDVTSDGRPLYSVSVSDSSVSVDTKVISPRRNLELVHNSQDRGLDTVGGAK